MISSKRILDLALIFGSAPLVLPVMLGVALLVRLRLGAPVLFRQTRPGLHGKPFEMYKFRSMTNARNAEGQLLPDAERLTPFGRWLRSSSLDELPELLNVLRGEMSLIGPRPLLMQYLDRYTPEQAQRHRVQPGLTGLAQVSGRNGISWDEKLALDTQYANQRTLCLDLRILFLTIRAVLRRESINPAGMDVMPEFMGSTSSKQQPPEGRE